MQDATSIKSLISLAKYGNKAVLCSSQQEEAVCHSWSLAYSMLKKKKNKSFSKDISLP